MNIRSWLHSFTHDPGDMKSRYHSASRTFEDGRTITITSDEPFTIYEGLAMISAKREEDDAKSR